MLGAQALLALLVNLALLGLVAKVIMLNDVLGTVSQPTGSITPAEKGRQQARAVGH